MGYEQGRNPSHPHCLCIHTLGCCKSKSAAHGLTLPCKDGAARSRYPQIKLTRCPNHWDSGCAVARKPRAEEEAEEERFLPGPSLCGPETTRGFCSSHRRHEKHPPIPHANMPLTGFRALVQSRALAIAFRVQLKTLSSLLLGRYRKQTKSPGLRGGDKHWRSYMRHMCASFCTHQRPTPLSFVCSLAVNWKTHLKNATPPLRLRDVYDVYARCVTYHT